MSPSLRKMSCTLLLLHLPCSTRERQTRMHTAKSMLTMKLAYHAFVAPTGGAGVVAAGAGAICSLGETIIVRPPAAAGHSGFKVSSPSPPPSPPLRTQTCTHAWSLPFPPPFITSEWSSDALDDNNDAGDAVVPTVLPAPLPASITPLPPPLRWVVAAVLLWHGCRLKGFFWPY